MPATSGETPTLSDSTYASSIDTIWPPVTYQYPPPISTSGNNASSACRLQCRPPGLCGDAASDIEGCLLAWPSGFFGDASAFANEPSTTSLCDTTLILL